MYFRATLDYEKADLIAFQKLHNLTKGIRSRIVQLVCAGITGLMGIALIVIAVLNRSFHWNYAAFLLAAAAYIAVTLLSPRINAIPSILLYRQTGPQELSFGEDEMEVCAKDVRSTYGYGAFETIYHANGTYYLYLNKRMALILPERCFTWGDPAAFRTFISQKTGLEIKEIQ